MMTLTRSLASPLALLALIAATLVPAVAQEDNPPPPPETGTLELYVLDEDGEPFFKASAYILLTDEEREAKIKASSTGGYSLDTVNTDPDGFAELEVAAGTARTLRVSSRGNARPLDLELEPFESGETRELEVTLTSKPDLELTCRVVAAESGKPLAGVRVHMIGSRMQSLGGPPKPFSSLRSPEATTDENGSFTLQARSWIRETALLVSDDRSPLIVPLVESKKAVVFTEPIQLRSGATLGGTVTSAGPPLPKGTTVHLEIQNYQMEANRSSSSFMGPDWVAVARVDEEGKFLFPNVASAVPLKLRVQSGREVLYRAPATRILDAGSDTDIEVQVGVGRTVGGLVSESDGTPAGNIPVWLMPAEGQSMARIFRSYQKPHKVATTGPDGRFAFEAVPEGTWHVGLAPKRSRMRASDPIDRTLYPAVSQVAEVSKDLDDLVMVLHRGHFIEGLIKPPEGQDTPSSAMVSATNGTQHLHESNIRDGTFRLGPLTPGTWKLTASVHSFNNEKDRSLGPSGPVEAAPNGDPVTLQLTSGGGFSVTAFEEGSDTPVPIQFFLMTGEGKWRSLSLQLRDKCEFWNLEPGTYTSVLFTPEGRFGAAVYEIAAGDVLLDEKVILGPGGFVDVGYEGDVPYGQVELSQNGMVVGFQTIKSGLRETLIAAPGKARLRVYSATTVTGDQAFEVTREVMITEGKTLKVDMNVTPDKR